MFGTRWKKRRVPPPRLVLLPPPLRPSIIGASQGLIPSRQISKFWKVFITFNDFVGDFFVASWISLVFTIPSLGAVFAWFPSLTKITGYTFLAVYAFFVGCIYYTRREEQKDEKDKES